MTAVRARATASGRKGASALQAARSDAVRIRRRSELVSATVKCIARSGLGGVTMQEITREAGLSLGIVNLHFDTKEKLLVETLRAIAGEYRSGWRRVLESDRSAAQRLAALVDFDFSPRVVERGKLAVWFAYWGETRARPVYRRICAEVDKAIDDELRALCGELVRQGRYRGVDPGRVAMTYSALTNGLWLDLLVCPGLVDRKVARAVCQDYFAGVFPRHFERTGTGG